MKKLVTLISGLLLLMAACQTGNQSPEVAYNYLDKVSLESLKAEFKEGKEPLTTGGFFGSKTARIKAMNVAEMREMSRQLKVSREKLATLATIPVPNPGEPLPISLKEAQEAYRSFTAQHQNDEQLLALFRQQYARLLLNEYGLLASQDKEAIYFYLKELISASSYDFKTMVVSVATLRQGAFAQNLDAEIQTIVRLAQHRYNKEQELLPHLLQTNQALRAKQEQGTVTSNDKVLLIGADNLVQRIQNSDAKTCLRLLQGYYPL